MKTPLINAFAFFILLCPLTAFTQGNQNVFFLKNSGKTVSTRDSADFIRIISLPDSGEIFFNIKEYYTNGKIKLSGKTSDAERGTLQGQCISFYRSGKREQIATYKDGHTFGDMYDYYPNGTLYACRVLSDESPNGVFVKACSDSTGKVLAVSGNGTYVVYEEDIRYINFKRKIEEGDIKNGIKDGTWHGRYNLNIINNTDTITYDELFDKGVLISGKSTDSKQTYTYRLREVKPQFPGGEQAFAKFLANQVRYPLSAKKKNTVGRVFVQFIVEANGTLTNFKILRDPGNGLGDEALRVLKLSPKWTPPLQFGRPVRVQFTVPINFNLEE